MKCFICWANEIDTDAVLVAGGASVCERHADQVDPGPVVVDIINNDASGMTDEAE